MLKMCCLSARHPCTAQVEYGSAVYLKWGEGHLSATAFNNNTAGLDPAPVFAQDATRLALYGTTDAGVVSGSLGFEAAVVSRVSTFRPHTESTACGAMPPPPPPVVELLLVPPPMSPLSPVGAPPFFQNPLPPPLCGAREVPCRRPSRCPHRHALHVCYPFP